VGSATALAALVNYLNNTVRTEITVDSPIELSDEEYTFYINYGGEYDYALITGLNKANVPIEAIAELCVEKFNNSHWEPVTDGYYVAATTDIEYYFNESYNWQEPTWRDWMTNHWDWLDWYTLDPENLTTCVMTSEIQDEYSPIYDDVPEGTTCYVPGPCLYNTEMMDPDLENIDNNPDLVPILTKENNTIKSPKLLIEPGEFYIVIKFGTLPNIEPGQYRISLTMRP